MICKGADKSTSLLFHGRQDHRPESRGHVQTSCSATIARMSMHVKVVSDVIQTSRSLIRMFWMRNSCWGELVIKLVLSPIFNPKREKTAYRSISRICNKRWSFPTSQDLVKRRKRTMAKVILIDYPVPNSSRTPACNKSNGL
ncbi:hypothetical protein MPTK1_2g14940 [Marchantia polymorpha subsp. ruderalis]|uniref:Uncharacterized protein n=1 Tax=Marchantia polymorpha TaxID=3197 RepID=A0A2R6X1V2_MARPO|nr:hypothetical protein MARPO_0042s0116 [Marchantia polymorpha]BBN02388.1 hypothetical protein Mp_2g14940 [Marchantia polymorpha subsp. ruderalis]|eukprot:PTQ40083.1 hypothetical protein MARPO_0042s0116 [Marchantia polymorpha]